MSSPLVMCSAPRPDAEDELHRGAADCGRRGSNVDQLVELADPWYSHSPSRIDVRAEFLDDIVR